MRTVYPVLLALVTVALTACGDGDAANPTATRTSTPTATPSFTPTATPSFTPTATPERMLLAAEGNRLHAYATSAEPAQQVVIPSHSDDPAAGLDINGQICFQPGTRRFVAGEDTGQPNPPPGWGVFELSGDRVGDLSAVRVGKLTPTFQGTPGEEGVPDTADPYGCAFLPDGRLVTSDIGNTASGPPTGQVIIWFPPLDAPDPSFCKLDISIGTAGGVYVDEDQRVYVVSARVEPGVHRYTGPFPTSDDAEGGCGNLDPTGAPLADEVPKELFLATDSHILTPMGVVGTGRGTFYVSSIINGVIAEYDAAGEFIRRILEPPPGETLGAEPYSTGTPLGLAIDSDGTVYYADLGLVFGEEIGPRAGAGTVRRIRFAAGEPLPPDTLDSGLSFPDGVGVFQQ